MAHLDNQYQIIVSDILQFGDLKSDRTGVGTRSMFGGSIIHNMQDGFPLLTIKKTHFPSVVGELLWFLEGDTNADNLRNKYGVTIWDEWADENGDLGPIYGRQWRLWYENFADPGSSGYIDQMQNAIDLLRNDPDSRRIIVSAWNVADLKFMALPPCHVMFQFYSVKRGDKRYLSLKWYQRSVDVGLGLPFNIASYGLLLEMVAHQVGMIPEWLEGTFGDCHIYLNHGSSLNRMINENDPFKFDLPTISFKEKPSDLFSYTPDIITLENYESHPHIPLKVAI